MNQDHQQFHASLEAHDDVAINPSANLPEGKVFAVLINAGAVLRRRLTVTGSTLRPRPLAFKAAIAAALREKVWPLLEQGQVKPVIHSTFDAGLAADAHTLMESNQHIGKIVLTWA